MVVVVITVAAMIDRAGLSGAAARFAAGKQLVKDPHAVDSSTRCIIAAGVARFQARDSGQLPPSLPRDRTEVSTRDDSAVLVGCFHHHSKVGDVSLVDAGAAGQYVAATRSAGLD